MRQHKQGGATMSIQETSEGRDKSNSIQDPREKILLAARKEFAAKGFYGSRMQRIADRAECNKAMLHYYFASKENLYRQLLSQVFTGLFQNLQESLSVDSREGWWMKIVNTYLDYSSRNRDIIPLILRELADDAQHLRKVLKEITILHNGERVAATTVFHHRINELPLGDMDPVHTIMSLVGLSMVSFFGKPLFEVLSGRLVKDFQTYIDNRRSNIEAVTGGRLAKQSDGGKAGS
jgi:AcrR family transcriptional regulator